MRAVHAFILTLTPALLTGCEATMTVFDQHDLKASTQMSEGVFDIPGIF